MFGTDPRTRMFTVLLLAMVLLPALAEAAGPRFFFLHHSTGRILLAEGDARDYLQQVNAAKASDFRLWDHDYEHIGLSDPAGDLVGYGFGPSIVNTDPDGLHEMWTTDNAARDSILSRFDVIAFKSCFPASDIQSDADLEERKGWYREMRAFFDQHPTKTFVVMSQPPLHRLDTDVAAADRARAFADWLGSSEFLAGHPNLVCFDLFDLLAHPDDGSATRNMLRYEYERSHLSNDSHPNTLANQTNAPIFVDAMVAAAGAKSPSAVGDLPAPLRLLGNHPNPFNPSTEIRFVLETGADVRVEVYDLHGRRVAELADRTLTAGPHRVAWNGRDSRDAHAPSGVYLYRVTADGRALTGRMVLAK